MGTSILATICAERLTKFLVRYSRAQSANTQHIRCNCQSIRRFFPIFDKFVQSPQKEALNPPMADRKYASMWLHRPSLLKPKMYGEFTATKKKNLLASPIMKRSGAQNLPRGQLADVSRKFLTVQSKLTPVTTGLVPKINGLMPNTSARMVQQRRMNSTSSRYSEYFPIPAHCRCYGEYLKRFESLKFCRNWQ